MSEYTDKLNRAVAVINFGVGLAYTYIPVMYRIDRPITPADLHKLAWWAKFYMFREWVNDPSMC